MPPMRRSAIGRLGIGASRIAWRTAARFDPTAMRAPLATRAGV
jgi:hypothetical protein